MDALWARSDHGVGLLAVRDAGRLRWRFDEAPLAQTRYLLLSADGGGSIDAWFATQVVDDVLHVRDFWSIDAARGIGRTWLDALVREARRTGVSAVSVELATRDGMLENWRARGFVERSKRPIFAFWQSDCDPGDDESFDLLFTSADEDE